MAAKILFILKRREMTLEEDVSLQTHSRPNFTYCISSGLRNSAQFVVDMLNKNGIEAKMVEVIDNNCIDREVTLYRPTHVIIEAFWVVPEKFEVLTKLHPRVDWIIRNHSEMPFVATEGIAMEWTLRYLKYRNVYVAPNSSRAFEDTRKIIRAARGVLSSEYKVLYLPNYYELGGTKVQPYRPVGDTINVGCFGAIRPLKNHLIQAIAAIEFANRHDKKLVFHINVARIEGNGNPVLKNIRSLFEHLPSDRFQLVEHGWLKHEDFLKLVETMDIGLQASFTETFNIVTADFVATGVPMVTSNEVFWMPEFFHANHTDAESIVAAMERVLSGGFFKKLKPYMARQALAKYNSRSENVWLDMFKYLQ